jgi:AhpC/TSA family
MMLTSAQSAHEDARLRQRTSDTLGGVFEQRTPPLAVGDSAPRFTLPASTGVSVSLDDALARGGPVVLLWYVFDFGRV